MQISQTALSAIAVSALALALLPGAAAADSHGNEFVHIRAFKGQTYVMYRDHMALYIYDRDRPGVSNCRDECTTTWAPALLDPGTELGENYSLIERADGTMQAAFREMPLYLYAGDKKPGDVNGDGIDGVWRLARP